MKEERVEIDGIPAKVYEPDGANALLLFGHGGGHSKDSDRFVALCRHYAEETGLAVVCIDAVDHGERAPSDVSPGLPPRWHSTATATMVEDWTKTANGLAAIGPAIAYVGVSMGSIFGAPTVAAIPTINAAVFVVGGTPVGGGVDDPPLRPLLLHAASKLGKAQVLMLNMTKDEIFPVAEVHAFFDAIPGTNKRLMFWEGRHDDWPADAIRHSTAFLQRHR